MSSRNAAKKMRPAPKAPAKVAKVAKAKAPPRKLAKVTKFPKVGKHAVKKPVRKSSPSRATIKVPAKPAGKKALPPLPPLTPARQVQEPKQSLARSFYWSELRVGDDLPPLSKPAIDRVQIARYAARLERIAPASERNIDVLFYGALIPRRNVVLAALHACGVRVNVLHGAYGPSRVPRKPQHRAHHEPAARQRYPRQGSLDHRRQRDQRERRDGVAQRGRHHL